MFLAEIVSMTKIEESLLGALSSGVLRQQDMVEELVFRYMGCNNNRAEAWATLVEKSNAFSTPIMGRHFHNVNIAKGIGADGWAAVRRVVERLSTLSVIDIYLVSERKSMGSGRREDIEAIWNAAFSFCVFSDEGSIELFKTEEGTPGWWKYGEQHHRSWTGMDQIIDMSEQEWQEEMRLFKGC